jgi:hypothetical protein
MLLEHFQEKWPPVFRRKCDQVSNLDHIPITRDRNMVWPPGILEVTMARDAIRQSDAVPATSLLALALGAVALGAIAIGAVAVGRLAVGRLVIKKARLGTLEVDELTVRKLRVVERDGPIA